MSLEADINWIKSEIDKVKDLFLVETLKNLLNYRKHIQKSKTTVVAYTTDGKPLTLKQYNKRLEKAEEQIKNNEVISHQELAERMKKW